MNIWARRSLMLSWLIFGVVPMVMLYKFLFHFVYSITGDEFTSQFLCALPLFCGFVAILWLISEIPVKKVPA